MSRRRTCLPLRLGGRAEHCTVCCETFTNTRAGDRHRTGKHGVDRRCRTAEEMISAGLVRNARGVWTLSREPAEITAP